MRCMATRRCVGLALAELLVALALGTGLVLAAASLHARVLALSATTTRVADAQDALRIGLAVLEHDLLHAGYWGLVPDAIDVTGRADDATPVSVTVAGDCGVRWSIDLVRPLEAHAGGWPLACAPTGGAAAGSAVLVLRRASALQAVPEAGVLQLQSGRWSGELVADGSAPPAGPEIEVRDLVSRAYYVSPRSTADARRPSLRRKTLQKGPRVVDEEIVSGIAALHIALGVDEDPEGEAGHGLPDRYLAPGAGTGAVVAVRIRLRAEDGLEATRTVRLRNGAAP
jgi:type IV pilus assembly protein PilW